MGLLRRITRGAAFGRPRAFIDHPGAKLLRVGKREYIDLNTAYRGGFLGVGTTGSGKTSALVKSLLLSSAAMGHGILFLSPSDETELIAEVAYRTGRADDLLLFDESGSWQLDLADYALCRDGGATSSKDIAELLTKIGDAIHRFKKNAAQGEAFWLTGKRRHLDMSIQALACAYGRISIPIINKMIEHAPRPEDDVHNPQWASQNFVARTLHACRHTPAWPLPEDELIQLENYFFRSFRFLADRTRSGVEAEAQNTLYPFLSGTAKTLFASGITTICPEMLLQGAIIHVQLPLHRCGETGIIAATVWKLLTQQMLLRRDVQQHPRPVSLVIDELQYYLDREVDPLFAAVCRKQRVIQCLATQNLPLISEAMGGANAEQAMRAYIGNLAHKFFFSQNDGYTNRIIADELVGKARQRRSTFTEGESEQNSASTNWGRGSTDGGFFPSDVPATFSSNSGNGKSRSAGWNSSTATTEVVENLIQTGELSSVMRTGGPDNGFLVDALYHTDGRRFARTGRSWCMTTFSQQV